MSAQHFGPFVHDAAGNYRPAAPAGIISAARMALDAQVQRHGTFAGPADSKAFVSLRLGQLAHEVFAVVFLDAQHRIIEFREMFRGTLMQTAVYPREVVKEALQLHAAAVVLAHNHPSGQAEPSRADELLTTAVKNALALVDVRVLDHLVVGAGQVVSFAERGLL